MDIIKNIFSFFFGFKGRISRLHYAVFLPLFLILSVIGNTFSLTISKMTKQEFDFQFLIWATYIGVFALIMLFKYSHITRRTHDFNKSFWDGGIALTIITLEIVMVIMSFKGADLGIYYICGAVSLVFLIILGLVKGTDGENDYGKKPVPFWKKK